MRPLTTFALAIVAVAALATPLTALVLGAPPEQDSGVVPTSEAKASPEGSEQSMAGGGSRIATVDDGEVTPCGGEAAAGSQEPVKTSTEFHWAAGYGTPGTTEFRQVLASNGGDATVPSCTQELTVTLSWTCVSPGCALQGCVVLPGHEWDDCGESFQAAASPLVLTYPKPVEGNWLFVLWDSGASVGMDGTLETVTR